MNVGISFKISFNIKYIIKIKKNLKYNHVIGFVAVATVILNKTELKE